jgi:hypothetical protein
MEHITKSLPDRRLPPKTARRTERGDLLDEFLRRIKPTWDAKRFGQLTIARLAKKLEGISTKDLYYLKSVCEDSKSYSKRFFWEINPKKHTNV